MKSRKTTAPKVELDRSTDKQLRDKVAAMSGDAAKRMLLCQLRNRSALVDSADAIAKAVGRELDKRDARPNRSRAGFGGGQ